MTRPERIPRVIHYCWYGNAPVSELGRACIKTWAEKMPGYSIRKWDESQLDRQIPYVDVAYRERKFAFVADYMRLKALYAHGGLYFDTDIEVIRPFDDLLGHELFFGLQSPDSVAVGVIGAVKGHPFLRLVLDKLDAQARRGRPTYEPLPDLITQLARAKAAATPTLLPEECFYPYNPYSSVALRRKPLQSNITEQTFCIHHWEGTWLGDASLGMMISMRLKAALRRANPARRRLLTPQSAASRP